jgi:hypothetical protein
MSIVRKIRRTLPGEVSATTAALEVLRRSRARIERSRERAGLIIASSWSSSFIR